MSGPTPSSPEIQQPRAPQQGVTSLAPFKCPPALAAAGVGGAPNDSPSVSAHSASPAVVVGLQHPLGDHSHDISGGLSNSNSFHKPRGNNNTNQGESSLDVSSSASISRNVYIASLPPSFNDKALENLCSEFGEIESAKAMMDNKTNTCKGYGFVLFKDDKGANEAIRLLYGRVLEGGNVIQIRRARKATRGPGERGDDTPKSSSLNASLNNSGNLPKRHLGGEETPLSFSLSPSQIANSQKQQPQQQQYPINTPPSGFILQPSAHHHLANDLPPPLSHQQQQQQATNFAQPMNNTFTQQQQLPAVVSSASSTIAGQPQSLTVLQLPSQGSTIHMPPTQPALLGSAPLVQLVPCATTTYRQQQPGETTPASSLSRSNSAMGSLNASINNSGTTTTVTTTVVASGNGSGSGHSGICTPQQVHQQQSFPQQPPTAMIQQQVFAAAPAAQPQQQQQQQLLREQLFLQAQVAPQQQQLQSQIYNPQPQALPQQSSTLTMTQQQPQQPMYVLMQTPKSTTE